MINQGMDPGWLEQLPLKRFTKIYDIALQTHEKQEEEAERARHRARAGRR